MGLHTPGQNESEEPRKAPNFDNTAYNQGFQAGEAFEEAEIRRNYAPGGNYGGRGSVSNILPGLISSSREVHVTPEIQALLDDIRKLGTSGELKGITEWRVHPCSDPKSVYVLRGKDKYGDEIAFLAGFIELIGNEIAPSFVRSTILEMAHETLTREEPNLRILANRLYTKSDVETRSNIIVREIKRSIVIGADRQLQMMTIDSLLADGARFASQSRNIEIGKNFFRQNSPNGVIPAMNACVTVDFRQPQNQQANIYGQQFNEPKSDPIIATALMIDFIEVDRNARWGNSPQFMPRIRITAIDAIAPAPGFVFWGLLFAIEKYAYNYGWMNVFYHGDPFAGDPANLFADETDPANKVLSWLPEEANLFWAKYGHFFGNPMVILDNELGRKTIPFQYDFVEAALGNKEAHNKIVRTAKTFFGENSRFEGILNASGGIIARPFSHSHTSIVSMKNNHIDSRSITYLSAMAGVVGILPTRDVGLALLQPNRIGAADLDMILREWFNDDSVLTPCFDNNSIALSEGLINAIGTAIRDRGMVIYDNDNNGNERAMFAGRNPVDGFGFTGQGIGVFSTPGVNYQQHSGPSWTSYAGDLSF